MAYIRRASDGEMNNLDVPFMQPVERGDAAEQARIGGLKRALRDIPQTFELTGYVTPEDLRAA
ncbi:MAG: hypothetical protein IH872_12360 [Chloroflexi bacterium]|nr:hypothetical protein [Chloroflexota bacterium]